MKSPPNYSSTTTEASGIPVHCSHDALEDVAALIENPRNPNKHGDKQVAMLAKIIRHQGWRSPIVVSTRSGFVVAGHGRLAAAKLLQVEKAPVNRQAFATEADEWAHLVADNRIAELAEIDTTELAGLLKELGDAGADMMLAGFDETAFDELMAVEHHESDVDAEPQIDKAEELRAKWGVEVGQLWQLGEHRLLCGDSTRQKDVEAVLLGEQPLLMVTDPPYGVDYDPNWRNEADRASGKSCGARAVGLVTNDTRADWREAYELFKGDVAYVWHPAGALQGVFLSSLIAAEFEVRTTIIWAKNMFPIGRGHYHVQHEPCFYAVRKNKTGHWAGDRKQTTLWQIDKPRKSETGHSTQKPIECMARPIRNNSLAGDLIYEPFSGSGTTIIACEQLGRKCRAIEISPAYVAVTLQRWADATGQTPVKI